VSRAWTTLIHDAAGNFFERLWSRLSAYRFFFLMPLLPALLWCRDWRMWLPAILLALGTNIYPYFYPHYLALLVPLYIGMTTTGLAKAPRKLSLVMLALGFGQFVFWYGVHLWHDPDLLTKLERLEAPNFIGWGDAEGRRAVREKLEQTDGTHLVLVRYGPRHSFHEWVANQADIDASGIVWARDRGPIDDELLRRYYPARKGWLLQPDDYPPKLEAYEQHFEGVQSLPLSGFIKH